MSYYRSGNGVNACELDYQPTDMTCQGLVSYAVYLSILFRDMLQNGLAKNLRESDPNTATKASLDDWIARLGWQDCYATSCRSVLLGTLTPFEIMGECGPVFCPVDSPEELECAVKLGIVKALTRANNGGVKTLAWLNWVIAPLGAGIRPREGGDLPGYPCSCEGAEFELYPIGDTLQACLPSDIACPDAAAGIVDAVIHLNTCNRPAGMPDQIWPGVIAAECIVRSMLPVACPNNIFRTC
jgi:hypothetical protein